MNKSEEDDEPEPEAEPEPPRIHSMSESLKWTRQLEIFYMEKNLAQNCRRLWQYGRHNYKTTHHMITVKRSKPH